MLEIVILFQLANRYSGLYMGAVWSVFATEGLYRVKDMFFY